jgi:hypothetical protein
MAAHAASPTPMISLQELYRQYTCLAARPGEPVPLSAFKLSHIETERVFSIFDEDYHISRFFHLRNEHGDKYSINGEMATHVVIEPEIRLVL